MAETACITTDYRNSSPSNPISRRKVDITIPKDDTVGTATAGINGRIIRISYDVPALDGVATTVTSVLSDEDGTALYTKSAIAEGVKTNDNGMVAAATPHGIVFVGKLTITATASAAQTTADVLISVILHVI